VAGLLAEIYARAGLHEKAADTVTQLVDAHHKRSLWAASKYRQALLDQGRQQARAGRIDAAVATLRRCLELHGDAKEWTLREVRGDIVRVLLGAGKREQAIEELRRGLTRAEADGSDGVPTAVLHARQLVGLLREAGQAEEAEAVRTLIQTMVENLLGGASVDASVVRSVARGLGWKTEGKPADWLRVWLLQQESGIITPEPGDH